MDVSPNDGGTVKIDQVAPSSYPTTHEFSSGANVSLEAVPASGYVFSNWSGDMSSETNPDVILIDCNKSIKANFSKTELPPTVQANGNGSTNPTAGTSEYNKSKVVYPLTVKVNGNGSTTPAAGTSDYNEGQQVTVTAAPGDGWQFDGWTGDVAEPRSFKTTVIIDSAKTVTANFVQITYALKVVINGGGSIERRPNTDIYQKGAEVEVIANPESGWQFDSWSGDVADPKSAITIVTMDSDKTIFANFSKQTRWFVLIPAVLGGILVLAIIVIVIRRPRTR